MRCDEIPTETCRTETGPAPFSKQTHCDPQLLAPKLILTFSIWDFVFPCDACQQDQAIDILAERRDAEPIRSVSTDALYAEVLRRLKQDLSSSLEAIERCDMENEAALGLYLTSETDENWELRLAADQRANSARARWSVAAESLAGAQKMFSQIAEWNGKL